MKETPNAITTNGAQATDGKGEQPFTPGTRLQKTYAVLEEARAILDRYEPEKGQGYPLNNPSQGEARRFLACIKGLMAVLESPKVESQPVGMLTR